MTTPSPPPPLVAQMSFFGERTRLRPLTVATRGDRCPSLTAFPFPRVLMLHPFHRNLTSFAVLRQWSSCPDPVHFPGKFLSFRRKYHAPPIALFLSLGWYPEFSIYINRLGMQEDMAGVLLLIPALFSKRRSRCFCSEHRGIFTLCKYWHGTYVLP